MRHTIASAVSGTETAWSSACVVRMSGLCTSTLSKTLPHSFNVLLWLLLFALLRNYKPSGRDTYTHLQESVSGSHLQSFQGNRLSNHCEDLIHLFLLLSFPIFNLKKKKKVFPYLRTRLFVRFWKINLLWFLSYFFMYWFSAYKGSTRITFPSSYFKVFFLQAFPTKLPSKKALGFKEGLILWFRFP